jgi:hypothetical protein
LVRAKEDSLFVAHRVFSLRCTEIGRYGGIADIEQAAPINLDL